MRQLPDDHHCEWREEAEELAERLTNVEQQLAKVTRALFGQKSEKMPPPAEELRKEKPPVDPALSLGKATREGQPESKPSQSQNSSHHSPREAALSEVHADRFETSWRRARQRRLRVLPGHFEKQLHVQETLACACGEGIVTADGPPRVAEQCGYGPDFVAHVVTAKCADSIPLHRLEQSLERDGAKIARSTLTDLFHTAAKELEALSTRLLEKVAEQPIVQGDETTIKVQAPKKCRTGHLWTFLAADAHSDDELIAYRFSPSRSGMTPVDVLGGTRGALVVDAYSGYNAVTTPGGRERVGCWAHVRRKFFDARESSPKAEEALALILNLYRVEAFAKASGTIRSPAHLALRKEKSAPAVETFKKWLGRGVAESFAQRPSRNGHSVRTAGSGQN